jgi:hypothetical protein
MDFQDGSSVRDGWYLTAFRMHNEPGVLARAAGFYGDAEANEAKQFRLSSSQRSPSALRLLGSHSTGNANNSEAALRYANAGLSLGHRLRAR